MVLSARQYLQVAAAYEKAAADKLGVPPQQRAAFARKARWFMMLARIKAKKEVVLRKPGSFSPALFEVGASKPETTRLEFRPKNRALTVEERLEKARTKARPVEISS
jgi:hypothetical protein